MLATLSLPPAPARTWLRGEWGFWSAIGGPDGWAELAGTKSSLWRVAHGESWQRCHVQLVSNSCHRSPGLAGPQQVYLLRGLVSVCSAL